MNKLYYSNYNSILNEGNRVRRMRRTQLSINKIGYMDNHYMIPVSREISKSNSTKSLRSLPKVQKSFDKKNRVAHQKQQNLRKIQNEYYMKGKESRTQQISGNLEKNFFMNFASKRESSIYNSQPNLPTKPKQQNSAVYQKSKLSIIHSRKTKFSIRKTQEVRTQKNIKAQVPINNEKSMQNFNEESNIKEQFHENENSSRRSDVYELGNSSQQNFILDEFDQNHKNQGSVLFSQLKGSSLKGNSMKSNHLASKISKLKIQQNEESQEMYSGDQEEEQESSSVFSQLQSQGVSVLKAGSKNGTSMIRKSSSHIKSLGSESILKQKKQVIPTLDKRMELKLESLRKEKVENVFDAGRNQQKNLPLTSRENSQRKVESAKSRPMGNSLEEIIEKIEIHDFIITLLSDFGDLTVEFHKGEEDKYEKLIYLMERKHFLQKSNMIKALKGLGRNVFNLSSIQIPFDILKKYLENRQIKQIVEQQEEIKKKLFKKLQKNFREIKGNYKNDPYIKLQTPNDNFSKCIVDLLHKQLNELYPVLQKLTGQKLERQQDRIIEIIEKIFVLSEFSGRKVKKLQFAEEIEDFEGYYEDNLQNLLQTLQYFEQN